MWLIEVARISRKIGDAYVTVDPGDCWVRFRFEIQELSQYQQNHWFPKVSERIDFFVSDDGSAKRSKGRRVRSRTVKVLVIPGTSLRAVGSWLRKELKDLEVRRRVIPQSGKVVKIQVSQ